MVNKKIAAIAIAVVAIVVIAAIGLTMMNGNDRDKNTIYWTQIVPSLQKNKIAEGSIDGGVSWEPYCSDAILSTDAHALIWSGDFWPNHPCCVVATNLRFAEENPELVARLLAAHMEATDWILDTVANKTENPGNYTMLLRMGAAFSKGVAYTEDDIRIVEASLEHMTLLYEIDQEFKDYLVNFTEQFISLNQTSTEKLANRGYSSTEDFIDTFVDDGYQEMAATLSKVDTIIGTVRLGYLQGDLHQFARVVASNVDMWVDTEYEGKSLFEQWGLKIDSPSPYANGADEMTAFSTGGIDMGYLGSPPAIIKHLNVNDANSNIRIVAQANSEGSAIIVNNDIQTIADMGGKVIATPGPGSIQHLLLLAFAEANGFKIAKD